LKEKCLNFLSFSAANH